MICFSFRHYSKEKYDKLNYDWTNNELSLLLLFPFKALECGINAGEEQKALKKITAECMSNLHEPEINGTEYPLYSPDEESSEEETGKEKYF